MCIRDRNGEMLSKKIFGKKTAIVPYVMPGFKLAQKINEVYSKNPNINCLILLNHGIYVPHGIIAEIAKKEKIHFVVWCPGVRKKTFSFSPNDTYHRESIYENNSNWENILLNNGY